jgi:hypothetical protein
MKSKLYGREQTDDVEEEHINASYTDGQQSQDRTKSDRRCYHGSKDVTNQ